MPKILENVREQILEEAKKQVSEKGYGKTTVRSVASACGIGVGTVYNYFESKDMLIASFMIQDWNRFLCRMEGIDSEDSESLLAAVAEGISGFMKEYGRLFSDPDAAKVYAEVFAVRHKQLREQLAGKIQPVCVKSNVEDTEFLAQWIAESMLTWTAAGKSFDEQYSIIKHLL